MKRSIVLISALIIAACSNKEPQSEIEYGTPSSDGGLQVPPSLSSPRYNPALSNVELKGEILPDIEGVSMERGGRLRYLVVDDTADTVWNRLINFVAEQKLVVSGASPESGLIRTEWMENAAKDKNYLLGKYFERFRESSEKDRFSFWIERDGSSKTRVYIAHQGQVEQIREIENAPSDAIANFYWTPRPAELSYEVEMLRRFMVFLGTSEGQSEVIAETNLADQPATIRARIEEDGGISYEGDIAFAWQLLNHEFLSRGFSMISRSSGDYSIVLLFDRGEIDQPNALERVVLRKKMVRRDQIALVQLVEDNANVHIDISGPEEDSPLESKTREQLAQTIIEVLNEE